MRRNAFEDTKALHDTCRGATHREARAQGCSGSTLGSVLESLCGADSYSPELEVLRSECQFFPLPSKPACGSIARCPCIWVPADAEAGMPGCLQKACACMKEAAALHLHTHASQSAQFVPYGLSIASCACISNASTLIRSHRNLNLSCVCSGKVCPSRTHLVSVRLCKLMFCCLRRRSTGGSRRFCCDTIDMQGVCDQLPVLGGGTCRACCTTQAQVLMSSI